MFASPHPRITASACVLLHGDVTPIGTRDPTKFWLDATPLPLNIVLCAPSILGYQYYDENKTYVNIQEISRNFNQSKQQSNRYPEFLLKEIHEMEQKHITRLQHKSESEYDMGIPHGSDRTKRLDRSEILEHKPLVVWKKQDSYITQKRYHIQVDDSDSPLPNCIMIYCNDINPDRFKRMYGGRRLQIKHGKKNVEYTIDYDIHGNTLKILFFSDSDPRGLSFDDIKQFILGLLVTVVDPISQHNIDLSIFDFTCDVLEFPTLTNVKPVLLSVSNNLAESKLVYGTIPTARDSEIEEEWSKLWPSTKGSSSPRTLTSVSPPSPSPFISINYSPSPAQPNMMIEVYLMGGVNPFVNFDVLYQESLSNSQSFPRSGASSIDAFGSLPSSSVASTSSGSSGSSGYGNHFLSLTSSSPDSSQQSSSSHFGHDSLSSTTQSVSVPRRHYSKGGRRRTICRTNKVSLRNRRGRTKARSKRSKRQRKTK